MAQQCRIFLDGPGVRECSGTFTLSMIPRIGEEVEFNEDPEFGMPLTGNVKAIYHSIPKQTVEIFCTHGFSQLADEDNESYFREIGFDRVLLSTTSPVDQTTNH